MKPAGLEDGDDEAVQVVQVEGVDEHPAEGRDSTSSFLAVQQAFLRSRPRARTDIDWRVTLAVPPQVDAMARSRLESADTTLVGWSARSAGARYAVALIAFGGALVVCYALRGVLGPTVPYLQFYPAIIVAGWYGGLGPGLLVTALSTIAAMYYLLPPAGLAVGSWPDRLSLGVFVATGVAFSWLQHRLWEARNARRADAEVATARAERLAAVLDMTVDGVLVIDAAGRIESFNRGAEQLFGYPEAEVLGRNVSILMPSPHHEHHDGYLARYLATSEAKIIGSGREVTGRRRDGSVFPVHLSVGEMRIGGERKFTGVLHDRSDSVRIEAQLREQEALARLGEMAAVIAHEVKNPLAGVRGAIQVFGSRLIQGSGEMRIVDEILARIDALDRMMQDLLLFARPPAPRRAPVDVVALVRATAGLLRADPALLAVDVAIDGAAPALSADADMLQVVFQNLLINGAHATQGRGHIRVTVTSRDDACHVAVVDDGPGIPGEIREKVFTPFFTTKSRGSGLGLPTVKRLVEAHDGRIAIECPPAGGTRVLISLPAGSSPPGPRLNA